MVYVVDLEEEPADPAIPNLPPSFSDDQNVPQRPNPNLNSFSAALACYPYAPSPPRLIAPTTNLSSIASQIASHLDLNTLHDLSATCRQFRSNLLQYRTHLVNQTLRCVNDKETMSTRLANRMRASWRETRRFGSDLPLTSGRVGLCARDMVGPCRNCGVIVCRVC